MIHLDVKGVRFDADERIQKYINRKLGKLDKYLPRVAREGLHGQVVLIEDDGKAKNRFTCEVTIHVPHETITAKESTINMYAAIDIVEAKIKNQFVKYKGKVSARHSGKTRTRWLRRLRLRRERRRGVE